MNSFRRSPQFERHDEHKPHAMIPRNLIIIALSALLTACGSCGTNEDAVALARSLSKPRLAKLFIDLETLNPAAGQDRIHIDIRDGIPDAFKDIDPQSIDIDGSTAQVHLSGCADDKALLIVRGIGKSGRKEITLMPGEAKDAVVLWQSN